MALLELCKDTQGKCRGKAYIKVCTHPCQIRLILHANRLTAVQCVSLTVREVTGERQTSNREQWVRRHQCVCPCVTLFDCHTSSRGGYEFKFRGNGESGTLPFSCCSDSRTDNWVSSLLPLCRSASGTLLRSQLTWNWIRSVWWTFGGLLVAIKRAPLRIQRKRGGSGVVNKSKQHGAPVGEHASLKSLCENFCRLLFITHTHRNMLTPAPIHIYSMFWNYWQQTIIHWFVSF